VSLDFWLGSIASVALIAYLLFALLRPERF
jgi:K+-transporting ATPase KdpF subunit